MAGVRTEIIPYLFYSDVSAALDWLARVLGFAEEMRTDTPGGGMHAQMTFDGQRIMLGQGSAERGMVSANEARVATQGIFLYLADVDRHFERAREAGAEIVRTPHDEPWGRTCTIRDVGGHTWFLTTPPAQVEMPR